MRVVRRVLERKVLEGMLTMRRKWRHGRDRRWRGCENAARTTVSTQRRMVEMRMGWLVMVMVVSERVVGQRVVRRLMETARDFLRKGSHDGGCRCSCCCRCFLAAATTAVVVAAGAVVERKTRLVMLLLLLEMLKGILVEHAVGFAVRFAGNERFRRGYHLWCFGG